MKKSTVILFSILFILASCKEKNKIEIIPDYDSKYISEKQLDVEPELIGDNKEVLNHLLDIVGENFEAKEKEIYYFFNTKLYIGKKGVIDKIQYKRKSNNRKFREGVVNPNLDNLYAKLTEYFETLKFAPGEKDGIAVDCRKEWESSFKVDKNNKADVFLNLNFDFGNFFKSRPINKDDYFVAVEDMPSPIGGVAGIQEKIKYPEIAKRAGIEGRVFVRAYINEEGSVDYAEILKGIGGGCDETALKAVRDTKFIPGKQRGVPQKVQVVVPILFKLSDSSGDKESKLNKKKKGNVVGVRLKKYEKSGLNGKSILKGKVISAETDMPIAGAGIVIGGTGKGCTTDKEGNFICKNIEPGSYPITVSHPEYGRINVPWLKINGEEKYIDLESDKVTYIEVKLVKTKNKQ